MASKVPNDILIPVDFEPLEAGPRESRIGVYVPITLALIGVGAILFGGISAKHYETVGPQGIDRITTGSIEAAPAGEIDLR